MTGTLDAAIRKAIAVRDCRLLMRPFRSGTAATNQCAADILAAAAACTASLREQLAQARADALELRAALETARKDHRD